MLRIALILALVLTAQSAQGQSRPEVVWLAGGHADQVAGASFSPDGQFVASASSDASVKLWRMSDARLMASFSTPDTGGFQAVSFLPDGASLLALGGGGAFQFRLSDGATLHEYLAGEMASGAAYSPDRSLIALSGAFSGFEEGVAFFRVSDGALISQPQIVGPSESTDVLYAPDGRSVIVSGTTGIRYWRVADGQEIRHLTAHHGKVNALAMRGDSMVFASGGADATIKLWNVATGALIRSLTGHTGEVTRVVFSPDSLRIASSSRDATIRIWDAATGALLRTITGHIGPVLSVAWSPAGDRLVSGGADQTVRLWNPYTGAAAGVLGQSTDRLDSLAVSDTGVVVTGGYAGFADLRRQTDGALLRRINEGTLILNVAISPDGTLLAASGGIL